ncbi:hypothetical protein GCM10017783_17250 [Deinococcus piscis]|uniref:Lantibiotic dehydratase n=1 Tax=Deinococcus piscis TaxID=394230 RepID=A0ABQ3K893_9DEIO|nr:lantibiotic dehydratase [Deinococcus piscis]GHG05256.1 hypothetical protein GCM10017783_17250 [Deinococcus piscis]
MHTTIELGLAPAVMLRTPLFPVNYLEAFLSDTADRTAQLEQLREDTAFMEALTIASPTLAGELRLLDSSFAEKRRDSLFMGVTRYLFRATTRCTPFGLFAGVSHLPLGESTAVSIAGQAEHTKTLRIDAQEVWKMVKSFEDLAAPAEQLTVYSNPTAYRVSGRLRLPYQDTYGQGRESQQLSIRTTPVVERILELAQAPVPLAHLIDQLASEYPDVPRENIKVFTLHLFKEQLLLSDLRPPLTETDPLAYLRNHAQGAPADQVRKMDDLLEKTRLYSSSPIGGGEQHLRDILSALEFAEGQAQQHLQVDTRLKAAGSFSQQDYSEIKEAITALCRILPSPAQTRLSAYADDFLTRYGNREVPLLEMLDPQYGLGAPAGYHNPASPRTFRPHTERTHLFKVLAAAGEGGAVDLQQLFPEDPSEAVPLPESVDVFMRYGYAGGQELLVIDGISGPGANTFGRFTHIEPELHRHWQARAAAEEAADHLIVSDLVYAESAGHANNVAIHAPIYQHQTAVACTPGVPFEQHVPLNDIMVGVQGGKFYLRSRSRGVQLLFRTPHVLNPELAPNPVRFLQEVSQSYASHPPYWSWEEAEELRSLPRVTYGRVVISPARWQLSKDIKESPDFGAALQEERQSRNIPRFVHAGSGDNQLLLDLDNDLCVQLLAQIVRKESATLSEALVTFGQFSVHSPQGQHAAQYIISFDLGRPELPAVPTGFAETPADAERWVLPFQGAVYLKLYGPQDMQDDVIAALRARMLTTQEFPLGLPQDDWFFIRYADPEHHLRWRILGEGEAFTRLAYILLEEVAALHAAGLLTRVEIASYERELERYGGESGIRLNEQIFAADSAWLVECLSRGLPTGDQRIPYIAATLDVLLHSLSYGARERQWVLETACEGYRAEFVPSSMSAEQLEKLLSEDVRRFRKLLWQELALFYPSDGSAGAYGVERLRERLAPLVPTLHQQYDPATAPDKAAVLLTSLTHMHANRAQLDRLQEFRALHLLLKSHQGFKHHLPQGIHPLSFSAQWAGHSGVQPEVHA